MGLLSSNPLSVLPLLGAPARSSDPAIERDNIPSRPSSTVLEWRVLKSQSLQASTFYSLSGVLHLPDLKSDLVAPSLLRFSFNRAPRCKTLVGNLHRLACRTPLADLRDLGSSNGPSFTLSPKKPCNQGLSPPDQVFFAPLGKLNMSSLEALYTASREAHANEQSACCVRVGAKDPGVQDVGSGGAGDPPRNSVLCNGLRQR